jgi:Carboxypeptidase regulatory-like domain
LRSLGCLAIIVCAIIVCTSQIALAQTASLRGQVVDESSAVVPKASVSLTNPEGQIKRATTSSDGSFSFSGLTIGQYTVQASASKLQAEPVVITLKEGVQTLRLELKVEAVQQQLTVQENSGPALSTESTNNASALVLKGKDLEALADDPEDLATDLQALAGPAAGPGGNSIYIDGFSGGQLPPKDAIREIRINQNPFSPEYDKLGYGRVEILTKPGANKFHGTAYYNFGDSFWNSRNPYAAEKAPFLLNEYGGSLEGPLSKLASFFLTVDRAAIDNGAIINGTTFDPTTLAIINPYTQVFTLKFSAFRSDGFGSARGSIISSPRMTHCPLAISSRMRTSSTQASEGSILFLRASTITERIKPYSFPTHSC